MLAIYALSFLDLFSVGLIKPLLPSLLQSKQIGATAYAGVNSACHVAGLLLSPFIGRLSDVRGRKSGIVVSAFVAFVGCVCYGLALTTNSYAPAVVGRLLHNLGHVAIMAPLNATIAGRSESGGAARLSMMMGIFGLGYAAGSAGGGWLGGFGAAPVLAVLCAVAAVSALLAASLPALPVGGATSGAARPPAIVVMRQAASDPRCRDIFVLQLVVACAFHIYNGTSDLYVRSLGYSSSELGYILSYAGTTFALCNLLLVPRLAAAGTRRLLPAAFVCVAAGRAGLGAASWLPPTPTILAAYVVCNFGQGLLATLLKARLSAGVAPDRLALLLSLLDATRATAGTVVPLVSGVIYDTAGPSAPAAAAAAIALSGAAAAWHLDGARHEKTS